MGNSSEEKYYDYMCHMGKPSRFQGVLEYWEYCFSYSLKKMKSGFNNKSIKCLFEDFDMENWTALHIENTEYAGKSKDKLVSEFIGECHYIADRMSLDRLFRCHWLFKQAFEKELSAKRWGKGD